MKVDDNKFCIPASQYQFYEPPEISDWKCEMFGCGSYGIVLRPVKDQVPNRFWRWMQYVCFGNKWSYLGKGGK